MSNISQYTRTVGAGKTFLSPTDFLINCNTNDGGDVIVVLPKISTLFDFLTKSGNFNYLGVRFYDIGNNASNNKIIVECMDGDAIGLNTKVEFNTNGIGGIFNFASSNNWFYSLNEQTSNSGSSPITIPTPMINIGKFDNVNKHPELYAYYLPEIVGTEEFLKYNPKYFLFMAKSNKWHRKDVNGVTTVVRRPSGFYHPTHQNGINFPHSAFYSGQTAIPLDTEYPLSAGAYKKTLIPFNPYQFTRVWNPPPNLVVPSPSNFPSPLAYWKIQGKKTVAKYGRSVLFSLAIGIENPDTSAKNPIVFGQLSEPFRVQFINVNGDAFGFSYVVQLSSVKRKN